MNFCANAENLWTRKSLKGFPYKQDAVAVAQLWHVQNAARFILPREAGFSTEMTKRPFWKSSRNQPQITKIWGFLFFCNISKNMLLFVYKNKTIS